MQATSRWFHAFLLLLAMQCHAVAADGPAADDTGPPDSGIYLVSHGWHTGIVIRRDAIPGGYLPEIADFPGADYFEFGWGDWEFYQTPAFSLGAAMRAVLTPTASVLHMVAVTESVEQFFPGSEVIELMVPADHLADLVRYLHQTVSREGNEPAASLGPGLYGDSAFYPAEGTFHLFNTCNVWTARALRTAGLPISDANRAEGIMTQARRLAR